MKYEETLKTRQNMGIYGHGKTEPQQEHSSFYQDQEMTCRYAEAHQDVSFSDSRINLHSHDFYEFLFCHSASDVEYLVGPERYRLRKGDIVIIHPGVSHRPLMPEVLTEPYKRDVLWVSSMFIQILMFHMNGDLCGLTQYQMHLVCIEQILLRMRKLIRICSLCLWLRIMTHQHRTMMHLQML